MEILFTVVAVTLAVSAFCSLLEATLYSTRLASVEAAKHHAKTRFRAERFLKLKRNIAGPTAAILILNTVANTAGATVAGMYAAQELGARFVPVFSAGLTLGILLFAEILPKTLGATHWRHLWPYVTMPLATLVRLLRPLVWLTSRFAQFFAGRAVHTAVTEDEIRASIHLGAKSGELSPHELQMLDAVFRFEDTLARDIMVPRDEVVFADITEPVEKFLHVMHHTTFSRYPACERSLDTVVGMLHVKDMSRLDSKKDVNLDLLVRDIPSIPETLSIARVMKHMQAAKRQMAVVIDEFGTTAGIITLTDILEQIVGSLDDELDESETPSIERDGDDMIVRGNLPLENINRALGWELYEPSVTTLSGFLVNKLGRLLRAGDAVPLPEGVAEVLEVKANRATRIRLRRVEAEDNDPASSESPEANV